MNTTAPGSNPSRPRILLPAFFLACLLACCGGCARLGWKSARHPAPALPPAFQAASMSALPPRSPDPALLKAPTQPFTLGPGDRIEIEVLNDPTTRATATVGPDGKIYYYLLPGLDVWGLTLPQAHDLIAHDLQHFVRGDSPVSVSLVAVRSRRIWMLGRFNAPGAYAMTGPTTLLHAIAEAGGPAAYSPAAGGGSASGASDPQVDTADLGRAFVMRKGTLLPVDFSRLLHDGDPSQNIYLHPGDLVYLPAPRSPEVHVLGAVGQPQAVFVQGDLTLAQAVAEAGGTIKNAYLTHVAIVRGSLSKPEVAIADLKSISLGQSPDLRLRAGDIVYVPFTPYRTLTRYVDLILDTFVRTVGVNEGARAISNRALPVGINVPVGP